MTLSLAMLVAASALGEVTYSITMTTQLTIPSAPRIDSVSVWQALPTKRHWHGDASGYESLRTQPNVNRQVHGDTGSEYVQWTVRDGLPAGRRLEFQGSFRARSRARKFVPSTSKTTWADLRGPGEKQPPAVQRLVTELRRTSKPADALLHLSQWIQTNIAYDAGIDHKDAESVLAGRRGHCGHRMAVVKAVAKGLGIEVRNCWGLALGTPDGVDHALYKVRRDYVNVHSWAEVHLPKDGWVEFEPSQGARAFEIPASFIQNNAWFQNYSIWYRVGTKNIHHRFRFQEGRWNSDFDVSNRISFRQKSPVSSAKGDGPSTSCAELASYRKLRSSRTEDSPTDELPGTGRFEAPWSSVLTCESRSAGSSGSIFTAW